MELFYNPERMSETEIKETFVAYQWLVDEILAILKHQPKGAGVQHVVIVAPRGMGKTTMLLMLRFTVLSQGIAKRWQPVLFPEESYSVYDLADLWVEVLDHVASETGDVGLREEVKKLKDSHPDSSDLEAVALASIKDWRKKNNKRLLLLIDNLDMILEQIGDEKDNASLRDVLMNDGTMMLVGGSTTFFKEARAYDQPLYNLFKIYNLDGLNSEQVEDLLRRRAKLDELENFEEILRANRSRLRVLEYFTGGNPRLVLMLYRVLTHSDISEVRRSLEKLLDEVTPYYKAKIETLPPQQRKILDQIARISSQTREGLTPTEIANTTRLPVNQVSSQLKRLADVGYVRAANIRGRSSYYTLSEPLYAIWHQMRFGRDTRKRMNWLIEFLKSWYDSKELGVECHRLQVAFQSYLNAGRKTDALNALEHRRYLMEAIEDQSSRIQTFESIILSYLKLSDTETLKREILTDQDISLLSQETRQELITAGLLSNEQIESQKEAEIAAFRAAIERLQVAFEERDIKKAIKILIEMKSQFPAKSAQVYSLEALSLLLQNNMDSCLANAEMALQVEPNLAVVWELKVLALMQLSRFEDAAKALRSKLELDPNFSDWCRLGRTLAALGQHQEAINSLDEALKLQPNEIEAYYARSQSLAALAKTDEALADIDKVLSLQPTFADGWYERGELLASSGAVEKALESINQAITLDPKSFIFRFTKAFVLGQLQRTEDALIEVNTTLELDPLSSDIYFLRALLLIPSDLKAAFANMEKAFDQETSSHRTIVNTVTGRTLKICVSVMSGELEHVRDDWEKFLRFAQNEAENDSWIKNASDLLQFIAWAGHWDLARKLINASELEQPLFPLTRSLEYLRKADEALIEKLSPEVRRIVDEIVDTLRNAQKKTGQITLKFGGDQETDALLTVDFHGPTHFHIFPE